MAEIRQILPHASCFIMEYMAKYCGKDHLMGGGKITEGEYTYFLPLAHPMPPQRRG
jgi:hypothetical protein